jgi:phage head maturation protease
MAQGSIGGVPIENLPDSSFAYVEPDPADDESKETPDVESTEKTPARLRHFPIRDARGKADEAHVRDALSRLPGNQFEAKARPKVEAAARELGIGAPAARSVMEMPGTVPAMVDHLEAAAPDGHGVKDEGHSAMPLPTLQKDHHLLHSAGFQTHSHPGSSFGRSEATLEDLPREDLVRALPPFLTYSDGEAVRSIDLLPSQGPTTPQGTLYGRFAVFDTWTEVRSSREGHFMERTGEGAFRKTLAEKRPPIIFNHGWDPQLGLKPIAPTDDIGTDQRGGYYRGALLDGVPPLVVSGLRAGLYGSSFRFSMTKPPEVSARPRSSDYNPKGLPEITLREAAIKEVGPGMFPVYAGTSATVRSETDDFLLNRFDDPELYAFIARRAAALPHDEAGETHSAEVSRSSPQADVPARFRSRDEWLDYLKAKEHKWT